MWRSSVPQHPPRTRRPKSLWIPHISSAKRSGSSPSGWSSWTSSSGLKGEAFALNSFSRRATRSEEHGLLPQGPGGEGWVDAADRVEKWGRRGCPVYALDGRVERRAVEHPPVSPEHEADHVRQAGIAHRQARAEGLLDRGEGRRVQEVHGRAGERFGLEAVVLMGPSRGQGLLRAVGVPAGAYHPGDVHRQVVRSGPDLAQHHRGVAVEAADRLFASEPRHAHEVEAGPEGGRADDEGKAVRAGGVDIAPVDLAQHRAAGRVIDEGCRLDVRGEAYVGLEHHARLDAAVGKHQGAFPHRPLEIAHDPKSTPRGRHGRPVPSRNPGSWRSRGSGRDVYVPAPC